MTQLSSLSLHAAAWFFVGTTEDAAEPQAVRIRTPFRIGRHPDSHLCLKCVSVSGSHAQISEDDGQLWVEDLTSTNGTFVNGQRITNPVRLTAGDKIQFGTAVFQVNSDLSEEDSSNVSDPNRVSNADGSPGERLERLFTDGVVPFFQPIVRIDGDETVVSGYEVLGRSRLFGLRTPAQMFAAASRLEMEAELSRLLRSQGLRVADSNLAEKVSLFVNTHPAEMECDGLEESLFEIRDNHPNRPITLEVHESLLNQPAKFLRLRATLQNIDIQLALHDFGAGQVRLAELGEAVPDVAKFDIRAVRGIDRAPARRQNFLAALVRMMKELGITPMAECVEQQNEHETLRQLGIQLGQGFFYGRPSSIADCELRVQNAAATGPEAPQVKSFLDNRTINQPQSPPPKAGFSNDGRNAEWLMSQPANHYTLQVLSSISEDSARQHIAKQADPEKYAIFCKLGKTRRLFIVVYGLFVDRTAAKSAAASFANPTISPWIRLMSSVQAEISEPLQGSKPTSN